MKLVKLRGSSLFADPC